MLEPGALQTLSARLEQLDVQLETLLAGGWRQAPAQFPELLHEADELASLGLALVSDQLRTIVAAKSPEDAVTAVAMALRASRLLRLRLLEDRPAPADAQPLRPAQSGSADRLLPVGRVRVDGELLWACAWLRGRSHAEQLLLIDPPPVPKDVQPWLGGTHLLTGQLIWVERRPVSDYSVDRCHLELVRWVPTRGAADDLLKNFREAARAGNLAAGANLCGSAWPLRLSKPHREAGDPDALLDPSLDSLRRTAPDKSWLIVWNLGRREVPLSLLLVPGRGLLGRGPHELQLVHAADTYRDSFPL